MRWVAEEVVDLRSVAHATVDRLQATLDDARDRRRAQDRRSRDRLSAALEGIGAARDDSAARAIVDNIGVPRQDT